MNEGCIKDLVTLGFLPSAKPTAEEIEQRAKELKNAIVISGNDVLTTKLVPIYDKYLIGGECYQGQDEVFVSGPNVVEIEDDSVPAPSDLSFGEFPADPNDEMDWLPMSPTSEPAKPKSAFLNPMEPPSFEKLVGPKPSAFLNPVGLPSFAPKPSAFLNPVGPPSFEKLVERPATLDPFVVQPNDRLEGFGFSFDPVPVGSPTSMESASNDAFPLQEQDLIAKYIPIFGEPFVEGGFKQASKWTWENEEIDDQKANNQNTKTKEEYKKSAKITRKFLKNVQPRMINNRTWQAVLEDLQDEDRKIYRNHINKQNIFSDKAFQVRTVLDFYSQLP